MKSNSTKKGLIGILSSTRHSRSHESKPAARGLRDRESLVGEALKRLDQKGQDK